MIRFLVEVYKVEIPDNGIRCDDLSEATEDWLSKIGKAKCYSHQVQGNTLFDIAMQIQKQNCKPNLRVSQNNPVIDYCYTCKRDTAHSNHKCTRCENRRRNT